MNKEPISVIRLYLQLDDMFLNILCSEENVFIKKQESNPDKVDVENFSYVPIEEKVEWLSFSKIKAINFLVDKCNIKRGILFLFDNHHNLIYYNKGYDIKDEGIFDTDVNIKSLPYSLIDV